MAYINTANMFAVISDPENSALAPAITAHFPGHHFLIRPGQWLVAAPGTAKEISDTLAVSNGDTGTAVIIAFSGYYGRGSTQMWEWIAANMGKPAVNA